MILKYKKYWVIKCKNYIEIKMSNSKNRIKPLTKNQAMAEGGNSLTQFRTS